MQISGGKGRRPPITVGIRKLEFLGYHVVLFHDPKFSRFDTTPACDGGTDGQRDLGAQHLNSESGI